jgi:4-amino-4-deoxy-L-arabinose transferase-like glycosyltransferase
MTNYLIKERIVQTAVSSSGPRSENIANEGAQAENRVPRLAIVAIITVAIALRVLFFLLSSNAGGDAQARATRTAMWLAHPEQGLNYTPWLPLHFVMMGGLARLLGNVELATRLLSLLGGATSLVPFYLLSRGLFGEFAAAVSLIVFACDPLQIGYSTTASSEASYVCLILTGLAFFFAFLRRNSLILLAASGAALTCAAGIRWEAWVLLFATSSILVMCHLLRAYTGAASPDKLTDLLVWVVTAGLWPMVWFFICWRSHISPFFYVSHNNAWVKEQIATVPHSKLYQLVLPPGTLVLTLSVVGLFGALIGLWLSIRNRRSWLFSVMVIFLGLVQYYQMVSGGVMSFARYTIGIGALLAVISGFGLTEAAKAIFRGNGLTRFMPALVGLLVALNLGAVIVLSVVPSPVRDKFRSISPLLQFPRRIEEIAGFLRPRMNSTDRIIIDNFDDEAPAIAAAMNLPILAEDQGKAFLASHRISEARSYLVTNHPRYIVYSPKGSLQTQFTLPERCGSQEVLVLQRSFKCVYENENYSIFESTH